MAAPYRLARVNMKRFVIAPLSALALCGCNTANPGGPAQTAAPEATPQSWICGQEYENYAWGYQRHGVALDGEGRVWRYDVKGTPASLPNPWHAKDPNNLSEDDLKARYNGAVDTGRRVSADDIAEHMPLIREAGTIAPTQGRNAGADMGETTLYCLARHVPHANYRQVLIDQKGDIERTNPSPAAKALGAWLDGIFEHDR
jgi:hypothetical protein